MSGDIGGSGASVLVSSYMSDLVGSRIAIGGGRRRWSVDQKLAILREAFGPDGSVSGARWAAGLLYTWRRQTLAGDLTGTKRNGDGRERSDRDRAAVGVRITICAGHAKIGGKHRHPHGGHSGPANLRMRCALWHGGKAKARQLMSDFGWTA